MVFAYRRSPCSFRNRSASTDQMGGEAAELPFELVEDIVTMRLPLKSANRFRCVCKRWNDLIHSRCRKLITYDSKRVYSLDGDNLVPSDGMDFPNLGSEHRLFLEGHANGIIFASARAHAWNTYTYYVMWNPANGSYKELPHKLPGASDHVSDKHVYFGFNSKTQDYNVLRVVEEPLPWSKRRLLVYLYSLNTNSWKEIPTPMLYNIRCEGTFWGERGCVDGHFFWLGRKPNSAEKGVVTFDIVEEEFKFVPVPSSLADCTDVEPTMYKGSIAVIAHTPCRQAVVVWVMKETGDTTSWVLRFSLAIQAGCTAEAFISSGELILRDVVSKCLVFWCPVSKKLRKFSLPDRAAIYDYRFFCYTENFVSLEGGDERGVLN